MICTISSDGTELYGKCRNEYEKPYAEIKKCLREKLWELFTSGFDTFYVNCEYGIPLWSAEIICAMKMYNPVKLNIAIPYEEQAANWCEEHRDRYFNVHAEAYKAVTVSKQYSAECREAADVFMLCQSDALAIRSTEKNNLFAERYAKQKAIPIIYL